MWHDSCRLICVTKCAKAPLLSFLLLGIAYAQAPAPPAPAPPAAEDSDAIFTSDTRLVELHATVTDQKNQLITNLPESAFKVYENDVQQEIKVFRREDAPVSLGVIIDKSASMTPRRAQVAEAALKLVQASNKQDEVFIMTFNDKPALVQDFTHDVGKLESVLKKIDSTGATAMRDALLLGIDHMKRLATNDKKALLVVTDGEDNSSLTSHDRIVRAAQQAGVLIYAIGLLTDETERSAAVAKRDLDALTFATGGEVFYPKELSEVDAIAEHVAKDLRNQYTIAYNPTNQALDHTFRKIKVTVDRPDAKVQTRSGYFADPAVKASGPAAP
jgi:Ca-activated chloride channel homolog